MANFTCGTCQFTTTASDEHIGRSTKCPKCRTEGTVVPDIDYVTMPSIPPIATQRVKDCNREVFQKQEDLGTHIFADTTLPVWAASSIAIAFMILGAIVTVGALLLIQALGNASSAPQQAAVSSMFAALFIAGYVIVRSFEKVVRALCRR